MIWANGFWRKERGEVFSAITAMVFLITTGIFQQSFGQSHGSKGLRDMFKRTAPDASEKVMRELSDEGASVYPIAKLRGTLDDSLTPTSLAKNNLHNISSAPLPLEAVPEVFSGKLKAIEFNSLDRSPQQLAELECVLGHSMGGKSVSDSDIELLWHRASKRCPTWDRSFREHVLPHWDKLAAAGLLTTILLFPDQIFDASGNIIEACTQRVVAATANGISEVSSRAVSGATHGLVEGFARSSPLGRFLLGSFATVLVLWMYRQLKSKMAASFILRSCWRSRVNESNVNSSNPTTTSVPGTPVGTSPKTQ